MQIRNQILQADRSELYNPPFHIVSHQENHKCGLCQHPDSSRFVHEAVQKYSLIQSVYRNTVVGICCFIKIHVHMIPCNNVILHDCHKS